MCPLQHLSLSYFRALVPQKSQDLQRKIEMKWILNQNFAFFLFYSLKKERTLLLLIWGLLAKSLQFSDPCFNQHTEGKWENVCISSPEPQIWFLKRSLFSSYHILIQYLSVHIYERFFAQINSPNLELIHKIKNQKNVCIHFT